MLIESFYKHKLRIYYLSTKPPTCKRKGCYIKCQKADAFAKHYADVSRLEFSKGERRRNRVVRKRMGRIIDKKEESCNDFSPPKMETALKFMKTKGAPGSDDIPPSFLKNMGPKASQKLSDIHNESIRTCAVPWIWRHAVVIHIIKAGKPGSQLSS